jgi:hypothetical protein
MSPKATDIEPNKNISMLLKSTAGYGKTLAAVSFASYGPIWVAYWDKNSPIELFTILKKIGFGHLLDNIEYDCYSAKNAHEYINKLYRIQAGQHHYIAGITDSVTHMTAGAVNWSLGFRTGKPKPDPMNAAAFRFIPDMDEYKVETGFVTTALELCKSIEWYNIWTAHPIPVLKMDGTGGKVESISKSEAIVSYGSKVAGIIPGAFTEIYHFSKQMGGRVCNTVTLGSDFAKTALNLPARFECPDGKLFSTIWKELVNKSLAELDGKASNEIDLGVSKASGSPKWKV